MHRPHHRLMSVLAASLATLALGAAPAFAGSDGCSDDGDCAPPPPAFSPTAPVPVQQLPTSDTPSSPSEAEQPTRTRQVHAVTVTQRSIPTGAVAAGAGGMAPDDGGAPLLALAAGGLVLVLAGGGLVTAGHRA